MQVPREGLVQKLQRLSQSQQSIESVSSFCIFYHKDARGVVQVWDQEFYKAPADRRLALLFLANHILQEGRKKGMTFQEEYFKVLPKALTFVYKHGDDKIKRQAGRLVSVWEERRVFGTKHIKSFREVMGGGSSSTAHEPSSKAAAGGGSSGAAAAAGGGRAAAADLGPVGDALAKVNACSAAAAGRSREFNSSWSQGTLSTAGLPEVTAAHTQLSSYTSALQEELVARRAAMTALAAETARQASEIARLDSQLTSAGSQRQQLEQQMAVLTQEMTTAVANLGQFMQQQNGSAAGGAGGATPPGPEGSPQAPELLLDDDDDISVPPPAATLPSQQVPVPPAAVASSAPAAPGINGGPLGGFLQQPTLLQPQQPPKPPLPSQQQPQSQPLSGSSLQALLGNPAMLSAAILGGGAGGPAAAPAAAALPGAGMMGPAGDGLGGMTLQLNNNTAAAGSGGSLLGDVGGLRDMTFGGFSDLPATFSAPFGGFGNLGQAAAGFADEGDDPYDPTLEG